MGTVPLPPWLRNLQQSALWQDICLPILTGFGGALVLHGCFGKGIENIDRACVMLALNTLLLTWLTSIVKGHSVGSASFDAAGNPIAAAPVLKQLADTAVELQKRADDPKDTTVTPELGQAAAHVVDQVATNVARAAVRVQEISAETKSP